MSRLALALLLLPLMAATLMAQNPPGPPWPVVVSPDAMTLRWYPDEVGETQAHAVADAYCAAIGRTAAFRAMEQSGSAQLGTYRCR